MYFWLSVKILLSLNFLRNLDFSFIAKLLYCLFVRINYQLCYSSKNCRCKWWYHSYITGVKDKTSFVHFLGQEIYIFHISANKCKFILNKVKNCNYEAVLHLHGISDNCLKWLDDMHEYKNYIHKKSLEKINSLVTFWSLYMNSKSANRYHMLCMNSP